MKTELNVKQFQVNEFGIGIYFSQFMTSEQTQHQAQNDIAFQKYVKSTIMKKKCKQYTS